MLYTFSGCALDFFTRARMNSVPSITNMGTAIPMMYSIQFVTVESWNGCMSDSSSQKNPRSYGCPIRKKIKIGNPTQHKMTKSIPTRISIRFVSSMVPLSMIGTSLLGFEAPLLLLLLPVLLLPACTITACGCWCDT